MFYLSDNYHRQLLPRCCLFRNVLPFSLFFTFFRNHGHVTLRYINGIAEVLRRILQKQKIMGTTKSFTTIKRIFLTSTTWREYKFRLQYTLRSLLWLYVGETQRSFGARKKKHVRNVKNFKKRLKHC